jgi:hypothetical protein
VGIKSIRKQFKPAAQWRAESGPRLQCKAWRPAMRSWPTSRLGHGLAAWSIRRGGPRRGSRTRVGHTHGMVTAWWPRARGGAARMSRVLRRIRCPRNGGMSTVRAAATCLMRWWRRGLTRAAARRAGVERRRCGDVPRWRRRSSHGWHRWWDPAAPEGKGEGEAHATCEPRRTEDWLIEEAETRCRGWLDLPVPRW